MCSANLAEISPLVNDTKNYGNNVDNDNDGHLTDFNQIRFVCKTQIPAIMANSKYDHDHKNKYLDTSRKISVVFFSVLWDWGRCP